MRSVLCLMLALLSTAAQAQLPVPCRSLALAPAAERACPRLELAVTDSALSRLARYGSPGDSALSATRLGDSSVAVLAERLKNQMPYELRLSACYYSPSRDEHRCQVMVLGASKTAELDWTRGWEIVDGDVLELRNPTLWPVVAVAPRPARGTPPD